MKDDWEIINKTMAFLAKMGNPLTREAVVVMLDEGTITQEAHFSDYVIAKNVYDAYLLDDKENMRDILTKGLRPDKQKLVLDAWENK